MKVDITTKKIEMKLLDSAIEDYKTENVCFKVYIFMNEETAKDLCLSHSFELTANCSFSIFTYLENNVYIDDNLKYGEVVIL